MLGQCLVNVLASYYLLGNAVNMHVNASFVVFVMSG